ncbi:hypothetical protein EMIT0P258_60147 [Pseudomonas sp. IT-P258]
MIRGRHYGGDQSSFTGAITVTVQRTSHELSMTDHVRNTTDDPIRLPVFSTGNSITIAGVGNAIHHDPGVTIQNFATTSGSVIQTDEMSFFH